MTKEDRIHGRPNHRGRAERRHRERHRIPALEQAAGILPGLPGSPAPYMRRSERKLLEAEYRLEGTAQVAAFKFDGFIRSQDATRYGLPQPVRDVARERDRLIRARARASGLEVDDRQDRPGEETTAGGLIVPAKPKRPRSRPRLHLPGGNR